MQGGWGVELLEACFNTINSCKCVIIIVHAFEKREKEKSNSYCITFWLSVEQTAHFYFIQTYKQNVRTFTEHDRGHHILIISNICLHIAGDPDSKTPVSYAEFCTNPYVDTATTNSRGDVFIFVGTGLTIHLLVSKQ